MVKGTDATGEISTIETVDRSNCGYVPDTISRRLTPYRVQRRMTHRSQSQARDMPRAPGDMIIQAGVRAALRRMRMV
eukprot:3205656-Pyramimonas_sp.AAC.1